MRYINSLLTLTLTCDINKITLVAWATSHPVEHYADYFRAGIGACSTVLRGQGHGVEPSNTCSLRPMSAPSLFVPRTCRPAEIAKRAFSVAAANIWNSLYRMTFALPAVHQVSEDNWKHAISPPHTLDNIHTHILPLHLLAARWYTVHTCFYVFLMFHLWNCICAS